MKNISSRFCLIYFFFLGVSVKAQFVNDISGKPVSEIEYTDIQGTAFYSESWLNGLIKMNDGAVYKDVLVKYNLLDEQLIFQNNSGQPMNLVNPFREFTIFQAGQTAVFKNGFKPNDDHLTTKTFYQILADGETILAKKTSKKVVENKAFNSATTSKTFQETNNYYLIKNGLPVKIKKDKMSVLETYGDWTPELELFIKANNLSLKSEVGLIILATYYNTLK
ncbi:MAG: hypothetical protein H7096_07060 [Flavobacterium sp.]|nr:hypothetical protein [Pedobacter sp.]